MDLAHGYLTLQELGLSIVISPADTARLLDFLLQNGVKPDDCVVIHKAELRRIRTNAADLYHSISDLS